MDILQRAIKISFCQANKGKEEKVNILSKINVILDGIAIKSETIYPMNNILTILGTPLIWYAV